jgi:hypothetical protein
LARRRSSGSAGAATKATPFDSAWLREDLGRLIDSLHVRDADRSYLRSRWLENLLWMETAAQRTRRRYYTLRVATVVGAVIVPALVSINAVGDTAGAVTWLTFGFSLVVAASAAVESFFRFGDRWRHYRKSVEDMKREGWMLSELAGPYSDDRATHQTAFPTFVDRVEDILRTEADTYIAEIATPPAAGTGGTDTNAN